MKSVDIAVIGGGVAGFTAGLYCARGGMNTLILEGSVPGGQTVTIQQLENYPGFPEGIDGTTLSMQIMDQATKAGAEIEYATVQALKPGQGKAPHVLKCEGQTVEAKAVIIATGAIPRKLGVERERELTGKGVAYCATCDGPLYKGQTVAVVGGGDTALTDALVLANYADTVYLIHRREEFRGTQVLQKRVLANDKIKPLLSSTVTALLGEDKLTGLTVHSVISSLDQDIAVNGFFVAVGISPVTEFLEGVLELTPNGEIVTHKDLSTSVPRIYAAGDCRDTLLRQVITAAGDGALAATSAMQQLLAEK